MKTYIIDAFTDQPFSGNPAAVCILESEMSDTTLQAIANEINLSETAFIRQIGDIQNGYSIRYFTPTVEIDFCGHATLAAAKFVQHHLGTTPAQFITKKGLTLRTTSLGQDVELHFPLYNTTQIVPNQDLLEAFDIVNPAAVKFNKDLDMLLIEVEDKKTLTGLCPDFRKAKEITGRIKEVVVTTLSKEKEFDFYSRYFCPWIGIDEDPVTGAAHSVLAKYWGDLLGKTKMNAYQLSKRGGFMKLHILNNNTLRVYGKAVIVFEGKMVIDQYKNPLD